MSRSYRKFPVIKDSDTKAVHRFKQKTFASRAVRRYDDFPLGKSCLYKKVYCSWFICDYRFTSAQNEKEFKRQWESEIKNIRFNKRISDYESDLLSWKKSYIRK